MAETASSRSKGANETSATIAPRGTESNVWRVGDVTSPRDRATVVVDPDLSSLACRATVSSHDERVMTVERDGDQRGWGVGPIWAVALDELAEVAFTRAAKARGAALLTGAIDAAGTAMSTVRVEISGTSTVPTP
jgi:hypothetical protein